SARFLQAGPCPPRWFPFRRLLLRRESRIPRRAALARALVRGGRHGDILPAIHRAKQWGRPAPAPKRVLLESQTQLQPRVREQRVEIRPLEPPLARPDAHCRWHTSNPENRVRLGGGGWASRPHGRAPRALP